MAWISLGWNVCFDTEKKQHMYNYRQRWLPMPDDVLERWGNLQSHANNMCSRDPVLEGYRGEFAAIFGTNLPPLERNEVLVIGAGAE